VALSRKINETLWTTRTGRWSIGTGLRMLTVIPLAPCLGEMEKLIQSWYNETANFQRLSDISHFLICRICDFLNIKTKISWSSEYDLTEVKS